jgi:hypothetical protein
MHTNRRVHLLFSMAATTACIATGTASAQGHDASLALAMPMVSTLQGMEQAREPAVADWQDDIDGIGTAVDVARLGQLRGGESTVENDVVIDGTVDGNSADHVVSGSNTISDGAFSNATGINTVIQNTGSNVLIQNGMVVNIQFVDPTP